MVDADAAVARTLARPVWEPVVLILLCGEKEKRESMQRKFSFGVTAIRLLILMCYVGKDHVMSTDKAPERRGQVESERDYRRQ